MLNRNNNSTFSVVSGLTGDKFSKWFVVQGTEAKIPGFHGSDQTTELPPNQKTVEREASKLATANSSAKRGKR